jgi:putative ABC transport system permease protein
MIPISYNLRSLGVRKLTASFTILGVALVTLVFAASLMLARGADRAVSTNGRDDVAVIVRKGSDAELPSVLGEDTVQAALASPGVKHDETGEPFRAAEVVVVVALPKKGSPGLSNVTIRGVDDGSYALRPGVRIVEGRAPTPGTDEAAIGRRIRGRFDGLDLGGTIELRKNRPLEIVGVLDGAGDAADSELWADRDTVRSAFGREGTVSSVRVALGSAADFDAVKSSLESDKRLTVAVERERVFLERQSEGLGLFLRVIGIVVSTLFSVGAMIGATITMHGAIAHRKREIGTLRALGFSRGAILTGFLFEAMLLTLAGGLLGSVLALSLSFVEVSMVNQASWSELVFTFSPTPGILIAALVFAAGMGLCGGFLPAVRASRISPLAALRS